MTSEIVAIVTVGVALAGVILTSIRGVQQDINELRGEANELRGEVGTLRERMAHLEELLEGLHEAITGRSKGQRGISRSYKKKPALNARALGRESGRGE